MSYTKLRNLPFLLTALVGAPACNGGGGGGGGGGQGYGSIPESDGPAVMALEVCRLMLERCDCPRADMIFQDTAQCRDAYEAQLEAAFDEAQAAGLEYHPECMGMYVNLYTQEIQCNTLSELLDAAVLLELNTPSCKVHSGDGQEGDPCTSYYTAMGDTCAQGLQCLGDTCMAVITSPPIRAEGEACNPQTELCASGTACLPPDGDPTGPTTCVRLPGQGEPCTFGCDAGLSCELVEGTADRVCTPPPGQGEPCGNFPTQCGAGLYCEADVCTPTLTQGTPCDSDEQCGDGLVCDRVDDGGSEVCRLEDPLVCI